MTEEKRINLENKVDFDWLEMVPAGGIGFFFKNKKNTKKDYKGFGGQFKRHLEQKAELNFTDSIPVDTLLYGIYQAYVTGALYLWLR